MPDLKLKDTGESVFVPPHLLDRALASGKFEAPGADEAVTVELRPGVVGETTMGDMAALEATGAVPESAESFQARQRSARIEREQGGIEGGIKAFGQGALQELTLGGYGALGELAGGEGWTESRLEAAEAHPIASVAGRVTANVLPFAPKGVGAAVRTATPLGRAAKLGDKLAKTAEGAGALQKLGAAARGGAVEGVAVGFGAGVEQLTDSSDPLTIERAASVLSSNMLFGGAIGGAAGTVGKAAELGLSKASKALRKGADLAQARAGVPDDLAQLDAKGLREARKAELDAVEAARVPERAKLADDVAAFRKETKDQKLWLATKGAEEREIRELGKRSLKADRQLDNLMENPKALAERPEAARAALQKQEAALEAIAAKADDLKAKFAGDKTGERVAALDAVGPALERNRALQSRMRALAGAPSSPRLDAIQDAADVLAQGGSKKGIAEQMAGGAVYGTAAGAVAAIPVIGPLLAPFAGAKAASIVGEKVFGRLGKATTAAAQRSANVVAAFADVTRKATPAAPVLATSVLSKTRFAPSAEPRGRKKKRKESLPDLFKRRSEEIRNQVAPGPDGSPVMRMDARKRLADMLAPIRVLQPLLGDRMETQAAKRIEFLAKKLPRKPDIGALQLGPDDWAPSDMEMRQWARYVEAVENPRGVEARLVDGTITPEDAEAYREVHPEQFEDIKRQIVEMSAEARAKLPYHRRLALSIFSGVAVDPSLDPRVLRVIQAQFADEPGSEGGTQAPMAEPQFGSLRSQEKPTRAQERAG